MTQIGFIGLGNMGLPMAQNLMKAGHGVIGFDIEKSAGERFGSAGGVAATAIDMACAGAEVVITMLPSGRDVRDVYLAQGGVLLPRRTARCSSTVPRSTWNPRGRLRLRRP